MRSIRNINLPLFLLALAIAVLIKLAVRETVQLTDRVLEAQVTYAPPAADLVTYELTDSVRVGVRGRSGDVTRLSPFNIEVLAAFPEDARGTVPVTLRPEDVRFSLAGDFDVVSITPDRFTIQVEPRIEAVKPIRVELFGEPAAGASAGVPEPLPATATVSGPESRVVRLSSLTIAVSLDGHARTFTDIVPIASGDPLVRVESPASVRVQVPMQEPELSIRFEDLVEPSDSAS